MRIDIVTLFPEMFYGIINSSIIKRASEKELIKINIIDFREYTLNKHKKVDDTIYGGGAGMLIQCQPIVDSLKRIEGYEKAHKIITSAQGLTYNQIVAKRLCKEEHIIIICGHYEGIDNRIKNYVDEEISIGDYVLTGGEIASLAIIDSVIRLIPNVITDASIVDESFENMLLEYPQYTKPLVFDGYSVPDVLTSGNHEEIRKYRRFESLKNTYQNRKDLLEKAKLNEEDVFLLNLIQNGLTDYNEINWKEYKKKKNS